MLHAAGRGDVPVALGARGPLSPAPDLRPATFIHGDDGLGNAAGPEAPLAVVDEPAAALLARLVRERPGELTLVTLGPLTNVGVVVHDHPEFARGIAELVVMGGSARRGGNALPDGEANIAHDPIAAQRTVMAPWVVPPLLVGLDVTLAATLRPAEFDLLAEHRSPAAAFLDAPLRFYREFGSTFTQPDTPCHDLLAVLAVAAAGDHHRRARVAARGRLRRRRGVGGDGGRLPGAVLRRARRDRRSRRPRASHRGASRSRPTSDRFRGCVRTLFGAPHPT